MAFAPPYPPYQQPLVDRATGLVATPWQQFFLSLVSVNGLSGALAPGSIPIDRLAAITASRLLGRGSAAGPGPVEELTLGVGLTLTGTTLSAASAGYWTPITNGDAGSPELLFDSHGDCIVGFVPTG